MLRQRPPEAGQLASRVAGGVLLVQPRPLPGLRGQLELLPSENRYGAAVAVRYDYTICPVPALLRLEVVHVPRKFSATDIDNAVTLYSSGKTFAEVSTETGIGVTTIHRAVKARGIEPPRPYRTSKSDLDRAVELYVSGKTGAEVAESCGVPPSVLSRELRKRGIPARTNKARLPAADIAAAYLGGESELSLAQRYQISRDAIRRTLLESETPIRDRGQAQANRLAKLSREERLRLAQAAHNATRGREVPAEELCRRAQQREQTLSHASQREFEFGKYLRRRGVAVAPQKAVGPYNIDFAVGSVAVEILGGNWHAYKPEHAQRTPYILNAGWHMLFIWEIKRAPLCVEAAEYAISWGQQASRDPAAVRQYRVIRGDGKLVASGSADDEHFPLIPPSVSDFGGRPID